MSLQIHIIFLFVFAYLMGSIPFGKIIASSYGIDIQRRGSGNIGFANVRRTLGWRAGLITLFADITKGFIPTLIATYLTTEVMAFYVGVVAILAHIFPIWLKFNGGKGIATGLGVILAINPLAGICGALVYVISCFVTKVSSYSSLTGLMAITTIAIYMKPFSWWQYIILVSIALWTLRDNLTGKVPNYDT